MFVLVSGELHASLFEQAPAHLRLRPAPSVETGSAEFALADVLITRGNLAVTSQLMDRMPRLALIIKAGSGLDTIDVVAARARGVRVVSSKGSERSVAELCLALILASVRRLRLLDEAARSGDWDVKFRVMGRGLEGLRLGLVGFGGIAQSVATLAAPLGFEVGYWDRSPDRPEKRMAAQGASAIRFGTMAELARRSDVLSVHLPLTEDTRHIIDGPVLAELPTRAILINTARAEIVEPHALDRALGEGRLESAACDVHYEERSGPIGLPHAHPAVICTPHVGAQTDAAHRAVAQRILAILSAYSSDPEHARCA